MDPKTAQKYINEKQIKPGDVIRLIYHERRSEIVTYHGIGPRFLNVEIEGEDGKDVEGRFLSAITDIKKVKIDIQTF